MQFSKENSTKEEWREYKRTGTVPNRFKIQESSVPVVKRKDIPKTTVLCVKFGPKYGVDYVEKLRNMVSRHLTVPYEFVCLTDDHHGIEGVRSINIENQGYAKGWWHKVHMFDPSIGLSGKILYLDLDVIIHSNIDRLITNYTNEFLGIRDFNRKFHHDWKIMNSSVLSWQGGYHTDIFSRFKDNPTKAQKMHGDQDWIWSVAKSRIKFWPDSWIQSYKWEIRDRSEIVFTNGKRLFKNARDVVIPKECSICVFHGEPNPDQVKDPFVVDNWR